MKKLLLCLLISVSSFLYGQDYPIMDVDSMGTPIVIITLPQAQKADFLLEEGVVCDLYKEKIKLQDEESVIFTNSDSVCSSIIEKKDSIIIVKDNIIEAKDSIINLKDDKIDNLKEQNANKDLINSKSEEELANKDLIIEEKDKVIKKWKFRTIGTAIIFVITTVLLVK